jgi:TetR/AcrR family transcriptional regulator, transcriptional repressor for nem operon
MTGVTLLLRSSSGEENRDSSRRRRPSRCGGVTAAKKSGPTPRQLAAARTRAALLDAGMRLAQDVGLSGLSISRIVDEAGMSKGAFFHHFPDRAQYLLALHREFHDRIRDEARAVHDENTAGAERLLKSTRTYLDTCLREHGIRSLLLEARAEPVTADEVRLRNSETARLCEPDFAALGWPHPYQAAQLWVGMAAEAALLEFDAGHVIAPLRAALARYLDAPAELIGG